MSLLCFEHSRSILSSAFAECKECHTSQRDFIRLPVSRQFEILLTQLNQMICRQRYLLRGVVQQHSYQFGGECNVLSPTTTQNPQDLSWIKYPSLNEDPVEVCNASGG